ncbi:hypothetical protein SEPCBS57363_004878 [Sporothrix epigloea]|uniref:Cyclin N-terminal domain-containing protein n=1 Tax=Sporothrix epigloea TaxID=1892477 RepID=A0ABP0DUG5_9PEZI
MAGFDIGIRSLGYQVSRPLEMTTDTTDTAPSTTPRTPTVDDDFFLGEDDDDDDEDYFSSTYRPLSNLPTPPPSIHASLSQSPATEAASCYNSDFSASSTLLGPAVHLANLLPPAASLATPSVALVQAMLTRAQLPLETVALAVCILDSLDSRFARTWRQTCPLGAPSFLAPVSLAPAEPAPASTTPVEKRRTLPSPLPPSSPLFTPDANVDRLLHIDAVFPEVIVLAALVIAAKFTDDGFASQQPAQAYCAAWGSSTSTPTNRPGPCALWTGAQLAATERCIMQNLGYRILPLLDAELLADAQSDMRRAGVQALRSQARASSVPVEVKATIKAPMSVVLTPPEEATLSFALASLPASDMTGSLTTTPRETLNMLDKPDSIILKLSPKAQRRHHASSHSECFGRIIAYER